MRMTSDVLEQQWKLENRVSFEVCERNFHSELWSHSSERLVVNWGQNKVIYVYSGHQGNTAFHIQNFSGSPHQNERVNQVRGRVRIPETEGVLQSLLCFRGSFTSLVLTSMKGAETGTFRKKVWCVMFAGEGSSGKTWNWHVRVWSREKGKDCGECGKNHQRIQRKLRIKKRGNS